MVAGFPPSDFWHLSPRLYLSQMRAAQARITRDDEARDILAWTIAALSRQQNLPALDVFLGRRTAVSPDTPESLQKKLEQLAHAWGAKGAE